MTEGYPDGWIHATIHLNPKTGEMHSDGDHAVRLWIESMINGPNPPTLWTRLVRRHWLRQLSRA